MSSNSKAWTCFFVHNRILNSSIDIPFVKECPFIFRKNSRRNIGLENVVGLSDIAVISVFIQECFEHLQVGYLACRILFGFDEICSPCHFKGIKRVDDNSGVAFDKKMNRIRTRLHKTVVFDAVPRKGLPLIGGGRQDELVLQQSSHHIFCGI